MLDKDCIFCKIISGDIPSTKVYEDEYVYAFRDINPQAPVHVLVIPKMHVASVAEADQLPPDALSACIRAVGTVARLEKLSNGFRVVSNCGPDACQSVPHLHFHVLGGRAMEDKMA